MALTALSPFFLFTHGTLLSHTSGFLATSLMLFGYISWVTTRSWRWAALAGMAWAWLFLGRTYTGFLIALPLGLHALWDLYDNRKERDVWTGVMLFAATAAVGAVVQLIYNWAALGDPFKMTYFVYDPREKLGFGPDHFGHSWSSAWSNLKPNVLLYDRWLWGWPLGLVAWLAAFTAGWRRQWSGLCLGAICAVWAGYLFFYYRGPHETGPGYYFETLPFVILTGAFGVKRAVDALANRPRIRIAAHAAGVLLLSAGTFAFCLSAAQALKEEFGERADVLEFIDKAPKRSLIFVGELHTTRSAFDKEDYAAFNPRGLNSDPLVVKSIWSGDKAVMMRFRDRTPYVLESEGGLRLVPKDPLQPFRARMLGAEMHCKTGTNAKDASFDVDLVRIAGAREHGAGMLAYGREFYVFPGRFAAVFDLKITDTSPGKEAAILDVARDGGRASLVCMPVKGDMLGEIRLEFEVKDFLKVEPRVFFTGTGCIALARIKLAEIK